MICILNYWRLLLLSFSTAGLFGCSLFASYPAPVKEFYRGPTTAKVIWSSGRFAANQFEVSAIAFHPDGHKIAIGTGRGEVKLWTIGEPAPLHVYQTRASWVSSVSVSPDGKFLAAASLDQPERKKGLAATSAMSLQIYDLDSDRIRAPMISGLFLNSQVEFSPSSQLLAVLGDSSHATILNVNTLQSNSELKGVFPPQKETAFFNTDSGTRLVAMRREWAVNDSNLEVAIRNDLPEQPDALTPDWRLAFFAQGVTFTNELIYPPIVLKDGGILVGSLDQHRRDAFLRFHGRESQYARKIDYVPGKQGHVDGWLLVQLDKDVIFVDLTTHRYQSLIPDNTKLPGWNIEPLHTAISKKGNLIAVGGPWGITVWENPDR
jgi:WD40 repeat protein